MPLRPPRDAAELAKSAEFHAGVAEHNEIMRELASEHGWLLVDAELAFERIGERVQSDFEDICHLRDYGNRVKARLVARALAGELEAALARGGRVGLPR